MDPLEGLNIGALTGTSNIGGDASSSFELRTGEDTIEDVVDDLGGGDDDIVAGEDTVDMIETPSIGFRDLGDDGTPAGGTMNAADSEDNQEVDFLSVFSERGIIDLDDDDKTPEDERDMEWFATKAKERVDRGVSEGVSDYKDSLPEEIKDLLEKYEDGLPLGSLIERKRESFDHSKITPEKIADSESIQRKLYSDALKMRGESQDDIDELLQEAEDSGLLEKHALRSHKKISEYKIVAERNEREASVREKETKKENYNTWLTTLKDDINGREEIIPGLKLNDKQRRGLYEGITKVDKQGLNAVARHRASNPDFDLQVAYLATVLEGDFSSLQAALETKATTKLKATANADSLKSKTTKSKLKGVNFDIMKKFV